MSNKIAFIVIAAATSLACSGGGAVSIGENQPAKTGELLSDYAATWDGYAEAHEFPSGSDRVRLTLDAEGQGHVEFGDQPLRPVPTDPDVAPSGESTAPGVYGVSEGFLYTAQDAEVADRRIQLGVDNAESYTAWCELQTPVPWTDPDTGEVVGYGCTPNVGVTKTDNVCTLHTDPPTPVDCGKHQLCLGNACTCTQDGCTTPPVSGLDTMLTRFDAALEDEGNSLVGTLSMRGGGTTQVTVRLTRQ